MSASQQIPNLNLKEFQSDKLGFVKALGEAFQEFGFCGVSQHGVDPLLIQNAYREIKAFFALPSSVKQKYQIQGQGGARGYTGLGVEKAKDSYFNDLKEFWHMGREMPQNHPLTPFMPPNVWPEEIPTFKPVISALFDALDGLSKVLLRAIALHLSVEEHYFDNKTNFGNSILRPIHYPPILDLSTQSVRSGQHEDINLITLLIGSEEPGLEILTRTGDWLPVTSIPGTIVCNVGDMLQRLTNHVLPSTTHRVINPPGAYAKKPRYSIPFFSHLNPDFLIETLPTCVTPQNPNRYNTSILTNDYLLQRLREIGLL